MFNLYLSFCLKQSLHGYALWKINITGGRVLLAYSREVCFV